MGRGWKRFHAGWTVGILLALATVPEALFEDVTARSKLDFHHENSPTSNKYLIETMG